MGLVLAIGCCPLSESDAWAGIKNNSGKCCDDSRNGCNWSNYDSVAGTSLYNKYRINIDFNLLVFIRNPMFSPPPPFSQGSCEKIQIWIGKTLLVVQGTEKFVRLRRTKIGGTGMIPNGYPAFPEGTPATWNKTM